MGKNRLYYLKRTKDSGPTHVLATTEKWVNIYQIGNEMLLFQSQEAAIEWLLRHWGDLWDRLDDFALGYIECDMRAGPCVQVFEHQVGGLHLWTNSLTGQSFSPDIKEAEYE